MELLTLARSGGSPTANSAGKVISEPAPAMLLITPASSPATATRRKAVTDTAGRL